MKPIKIGNGLFTCPYCQERLVVTWSGHYVRDPHNFKQVTIAHLLRRQSRPFARIIRDFGNLARPSVVVAIGSAVLFGVSVITLESLNAKHHTFQGIVDQVTDVVNPPETSP